MAIKAERRPKNRYTDIGGFYGALGTSGRSQEKTALKRATGFSAVDEDRRPTLALQLRDLLSRPEFQTSPSVARGMTAQADVTPTSLTDAVNSILGGGGPTAAPSAPAGVPIDTTSKEIQLARERMGLSPFEKMPLYDRGASGTAVSEMTPLQAVATRELGESPYTTTGLGVMTGDLGNTVRGLSEIFGPDMKFADVSTPIGPGSTLTGRSRTLHNAVVAQRVRDALAEEAARTGDPNWQGSQETPWLNAERALQSFPTAGERYSFAQAAAGPAIKRPTGTEAPGINYSTGLPAVSISEPGYDITTRREVMGPTGEGAVLGAVGAGESYPGMFKDDTSINPEEVLNFGAGSGGGGILGNAFKSIADYALTPTPEFISAYNARQADPRNTELSKPEWQEFGRMMSERFGVPGAVATMGGSVAYPAIKETLKAIPGAAEAVNTLTGWNANETSPWTPGQSLAGIKGAISGLNPFGSGRNTKGSTYDLTGTPELNLGGVGRSTALNQGDNLGTGVYYSSDPSVAGNPWRQIRPEYSTGKGFNPGNPAHYVPQGSETEANVNMGDITGVGSNRTERTFQPFRTTGTIKAVTEQSPSRDQYNPAVPGTNPNYPMYTPSNQVSQGFSSIPSTDTTYENVPVDYNFENYAPSPTTYERMPENYNFENYAPSPSMFQAPVTYEFAPSSFDFAPVPSWTAPVSFSSSPTFGLFKQGGFVDKTKLGLDPEAYAGSFTPAETTPLATGGARLGEIGRA